MGMYGLVFGICYVYISTTVVWTQTLKSECGCYGSVFNASCNSTEQIAIHRLLYGTKTIVSGCPQETNINDTPNNCCTFNATADCMFDIQSESNWTYQQHVECIGKSSCTLQVTWAPTPESCGATGTHLPNSNFMCLEYYCVPKTDIAPICDESGKTYSDNSTLYISNNQYVDPTIQSDCCSCKISTNDSASTINFTSIDFRLNETTICEQRLILQDGEHFNVFECDQRNKFRFKHLYTSTENAVDIYFNNMQRYGYLWLKISSTTDVTVKCTGSSTTCPTSPAITTTPTTRHAPTTTPTTTTAPPCEDDCFLNYGLPVLVSSLVVGVVAVVAASVFWFKRGQRSALNKVSSDNSTPVTRLTDDNSVIEMERSDHPLPPFNIRYNHLPPIGTHSSDV